MRFQISYLRGGTFDDDLVRDRLVAVAGRSEEGRKEKGEERKEHGKKLEIFAGLSKRRDAHRRILDSCFLSDNTFCNSGQAVRRILYRWQDSL